MREETLARLLTAGGAALLLAFSLGPFAFMLLVGMAESPRFLAPETAYMPTADHFREALDPALKVPAYLRNSLLVAAAAAVIAPLVAGLAAYPLARMPLRGRGVVLLSALALSMFPPVSMAGYLFRMMAGLGWINTHAALIAPYVAWLLPISLWFLSGSLAALPKELDRAALVDGCSRFQVLRKVLLPLAAPGLASASLLAFIFAYNEFLFALLLTVDHRARTVPVGIALFQGLHGEVPWGTLMAVSVLAALPVAALALCFQRWIVGGLTRGAVKG